MEQRTSSLGLFRETPENVSRKFADTATFREHTAALILAGIVANPERGQGDAIAFLAQQAVALADALCQELARPTDLQA